MWWPFRSKQEEETPKVPEEVLARLARRCVMTRRCSLLQPVAAAREAVACTVSLNVGTFAPLLLRLLVGAGLGNRACKPISGRQTQKPLANV